MYLTDMKTRTEPITPRDRRALIRAALLMPDPATVTQEAIDAITGIPLCRLVFYIHTTILPSEAESGNFVNRRRPVLDSPEIIRVTALFMQATINAAYPDKVQPTLIELHKIEDELGWAMELRRKEAYLEAMHNYLSPFTPL